jgi:hypothetical protein
MRSKRRSECLAIAGVDPGRAHQKVERMCTRERTGDDARGQDDELFVVAVVAVDRQKSAHQVASRLSS